MGERITERNRSQCENIEWPGGLNCYSFAARCDSPPGPKGKGCVACVPGARAAAVVSMTPLTPRGLVDACIADGFDYSGWGGGPQPKCPPGHYLVAVFIDYKPAGNSYHFARQDDNGIWLHKPSAVQPAINWHNGYILGTDLSNVPWGSMKLITYLRARLPRVIVASAQGAFPG